MAKIKKDDLFETGLFETLKTELNSAKEITVALTTALNALNTATKTLKDTASGVKDDLLGVDRKKVQDLEKFNKLTKEAGQAAINQEKVNKQKLQTEQQLERNRQTEIRTQVLLRKEKERLAKASSKNAKAAHDENNEYKKLVIETRNIKNESKRLGAEMLKLERSGKKNSKEYRNLSRVYTNTSKKARGLDKSLKKIDSTVGDNFRKVGSYTKSLNGLKTSMLSMIGAFGAIQVIRGAGQTIAEFDTQVKSLVSITGASGKDLEFFKKQAMTLGAEVEGGAASVIEAYKLIGSAKPELLDNAEALDALTQSAITLSQASGLDLPDAATRLTDAMNQFGAPAEDAAKFIDVLANASLEGSAAIPDVTDALLKFGAVAKVSNVSVEESAALIEVLASKGLKGAEAGTALRNVMLKLSAPDALPKEAQEMMKKLGISFEEITDTSKPFAERLKAMKPLLSDNAALQKVFGKENEVAAINLLELTDETERLTVAMGNQGTAQMQAAENTDTIAFAFNKLKETWNSFVLSVNEGSGIGEMVKDLFLFMAENLETIVKWGLKAVGAFVFYKAALIGVAAKNFLLNGGLKDTIKSLAAQTKGFFKMGKAAKAGGDGVKSAGKAMNAVPWLLIISLAIEFATALWDIASNSKRAREAEEARAAATERNEKKAAILIEITNKKLAEQLRLLDKKTREDAAAARASGDLAKATKIENDAHQKKIDLTKQSIAELSKVGKAEGKRLQTMQENAAAIGKLEIEVLNDKNTAAQARAVKLLQESGISIGNEFRDRGVNINAAIKKFSAEFQAQLPLVSELGKATKELTNSLDELEVQQTETTAASKASSHSSFSATKTEKKRNTEFKNQIDLLKELNDLMQERLSIQKEFDDIDRQSEIDDLNVIIEAEKERQLASVRNAEEPAEVETNLDSIREEVEKRKNLEIEGIEATRDFEIAALERLRALKFKTMREDLEAQHKALLAQANLTEEERKKINDQFAAESIKIDALELDSAKNHETEIINLKKDANSEIIEIERNTANEIDDIGEELQDAERVRMEEFSSEYDDKNKELVDSDAEAAAKRKAIIDALTAHMIKKTDERIQELDKEINAHQKQADFFRGLAESGNITAKESLAEENRIIAEKNAEKARLQKRKQRIQLASTFLSSYNQKLADGQSGTEAFLSAAAEVGTITAFLNTIPTYLEGIENTGKQGAGIDGKGGFLSVLHPEERVLTKEQNAKVGNMTNQDLAMIAENHRTSDQTDAGIQLHMGFDSQRVVDELMNVQGEMKNVRQAINDKPVPSYAVGETFQKSFEIIEEMQSKHGKTQNTFIVKPN